MGFKDLVKSGWSKAKDTASNLKTMAENKIQEIKNDKELKKALEEEFMRDKSIVKFKICFINGKEKESFGLLDLENSIIRLDADIKPAEIKYLKDVKKGNVYYIKYVNPNKYKFNAEIKKDEEVIIMTKELDEITYTTEKPKENIPTVMNQTTYNIDNHSTNYRGIKYSNINSSDAKVDSKKEVNVDVSANLQQNKGE